MWGQDGDARHNVVEVYVGYLRRKLALPGRPAPIETRRSVGLSPRRPVPDLGATRGLRARLTLSIAAVLVLAVGATFVAVYRGTGHALRQQVDRDLRVDAAAFAARGVPRGGQPSRDRGSGQALHRRASPFAPRRGCCWSACRAPGS